MTSTDTRPSARPLPPNRPARRRRLPTFDLSATQLIATALAAITATVAASYLGVTGTVIGAALASVTTAVGNAVYGQSLRRTRERVRDVVPVTRLNPRLHTSALPTGQPTVQPTVQAGGGPDAIDAASGASDADGPPELPAGRPREAVLWRRVAFAAIGTFLAVIAALTCVEAIAGRPVSDLLRGDAGAGTSLFGHVTVRTRTVPATPTVTVTVIPKVVISTPTVTQTAPTQTQTQTQSGAGAGATPAGSTPPSAGTSTDAPDSTPAAGLPTPP